MGRGRAKAKQTKVARDLKYRTYQTDFSSLEKELRVNHSDSAEGGEVDYAEAADRYGDDEEFDDEPQPGAADVGRRIG